MRITDEELAHLETLARLRIAPEEREAVRDDLARVLAHLGTLSAVDVAGLTPMLRPVHVEDGTRDDERTYGLTHDAVGGTAQAVQEGFLRVPRTGADEGG